MKSINKKDSNNRWAQYYKKGANRPPREFFRRTLMRFETAGSAIDLGCGTGAESITLLKNGWHVSAIDQQEAAIQTLLSSVPPSEQENLQTIVAPFATVTLPQVDFIWAGLSLPFCHPDHFDALWQKIRSALNENGRFAGNFFGPNHAWTNNKEMTFHTKEQVLALCAGLHLEYFIEEEGKQQTALNGMQQWHMFTVCVRLNDFAS